MDLIGEKCAPQRRRQFMAHAIDELRSDALRERTSIILEDRSEHPACCEWATKRSILHRMLRKKSIKPCGVNVYSQVLKYRGGKVSIVSDINCWKFVESMTRN